MHITSSYYRYRQRADELALGAAPEASPSENRFCQWPRVTQPLSPSKRTLQRLARRYNSNRKQSVV